MTPASIDTADNFLKDLISNMGSPYKVPTITMNTLHYATLGSINQYITPPSMLEVQKR